MRRDLRFYPLAVAAGVCVFLGVTVFDALWLAGLGVLLALVGWLLSRRKSSAED